MSDDEARREEASAELRLREKYFVLTGIIRRSVVCWKNDVTQVDALNPDCWQANARYLRITNGFRDGQTFCSHLYRQSSSPPDSTAKLRPFFPGLVKGHSQPDSFLNTCVTIVAVLIVITLIVMVIILLKCFSGREDCPRTEGPYNPYSNVSLSCESEGLPRLR
ncbi:hypothetical protein MRX96_035056 [Rhipicephalus microplus]